jgi:AbrB family looped-hinge helix DNA binding protein
MPTATLTSKAQLTLPKEIREHLGVEKGDRVEFRRDPSGRVWVEAATLDLTSLRGLFGPVERRRTQEELDEAVRRGASGEPK